MERWSWNDSRVLELRVPLPYGPRDTFTLLTSREPVTGDRELYVWVRNTELGIAEMVVMWPPVITEGRGAVRDFLRKTGLVSLDTVKS